MGVFTKEILRIIDANINRASEGIRILEEFSRMLLDDYNTSIELKEIRHFVRKSLSSSLKNNESIVVFRDSDNDIFKDSDTSEERKRNDVISILRANASRSQEALRVLEEFIKLIEPEKSVRIKQVRFKLYTIEKTILEKVQKKQFLSNEKFKICLLIDSFDSSIEDFLKKNIFADKNIILTIILENKSLSDDRIIETFINLFGKADRKRINIIVSDRADYAEILNADGILLNKYINLSNNYQRTWGNKLLIGEKISNYNDKYNSGIDFLLIEKAEINNIIEKIDYHSESKNIPLVFTDISDNNLILKIAKSDFLGLAFKFIPGKFETLLPIIKSILKTREKAVNCDKEKQVD